MKLRALALTVCLVVCGPVRASAGLTSVGVDPGQTNNQQADPTLSQVAAAQNAANSVPNTPGTVVTSVAGNAAKQQGAAGTSGAGDKGPGGAPNAAAVAPRIVVPPPPPDPATLPVSVIRPLSKTPESATTPGASSAATSEPAAPKSGDEVRPGPANNAKPRSGLPVPSAPTLSARTSASSAPPRADETARAAPEPEVPADGRSSSVIFYSGTAIAAAIVLLSLGAFFRGGGGADAKPRSL